jgi:hypothetical protein
MPSLRLLPAVLLVLVIIAPVALRGQDSATVPEQQPTTSQQPKRLYIEERVKTSTGASVHCDNYGNCFAHQGTSSRNVSLELTRKIMEKCPSTITVTDSHDVADYDLRISPGSSTMFKQNGDVAYVSPTRFRVSNLAKDVCAFVAAHP